MPPTHPPSVDRPRLRPGLAIAPGQDDGVPVTWVRAGSRILKLRGTGVPRMLSLLDGTRTLEEVCGVLASETPERVAAVVDHLRKNGLLDPTALVSPSFAAQARALCDLGFDGPAVLRAIAAARVVVAGEEPVASAVLRALRRWGMRRAKRAAPGFPHGADLAVITHDADAEEALSVFNANAVRARLPWLLVQAGGFRVRLGPLFLPPETACFVCYARRLDGNMAAYEHHTLFTDALRRPEARLPPRDDVAPGVAILAGELAAAEAVRFLASGTSGLAPVLYGAFADYALTGHTASVHPVLKVPRCAACGTKAAGYPTLRAWMEPYGPEEAP
jgi:oxazoline/thiazoline synthase